MSKERKRSWDGELSDENDDIKKARRASCQSEELNLEDELLLEDGDDDDLLRSDPEEDELSLMPENDDLTSDLIGEEETILENEKSKTKPSSPQKEKIKDSISKKTDLEPKKRLLSEAKDDPLDSLDYDEDSDGDEKREKFSSERSKPEEITISTTASNGNHKKKANQSNNKSDKNVRSKDSNAVKSKAPPVIQYNSRGIPNPPPHYPPPSHPYGMPIMRPAPPMMNVGGNPRKILVNPKFKNKVVNQQPPPVMLTQPPPGYNRQPMVMMNQFPPGMGMPPGMPPGIPPPNMGVPPPPGMMPPGAAAPRHPQFK